MTSQSEDAAEEQRPDSVARVNNSSVTEISRKLKHLLHAFGLKEHDLIQALGTRATPRTPGLHVGKTGGAPGPKKERDHEVITARTVRGWLKDTRVERIIYPYAQARIIRFFESETPGLDLPDDILRLDWNAFVLLVDTVAKKLSKEIVLPLAASPTDLEDDIIEYLVGKYRLYRLSFADTGEIISEVGLISQVGNSKKQLKIEIYSPPADIARTVGTLSDAERFTGVLFRFGNMFYVAASFSEGDSSRMRYYHFPKLGISRWVHYGICSGFSSNLGEPVATKILAVKTRDPSVDPEKIDVSMIDRHQTSDEKMAAVTGLVDNHIGGDGHRVLSVQQSQVINLLSRLKDPKPASRKPAS